MDTNNNGHQLIMQTEGQDITFDVLAHQIDLAHEMLHAKRSATD